MSQVTFSGHKSFVDKCACVSGFRRHSGVLRGHLAEHAEELRAEAGRSQPHGGQVGKECFCPELWTGKFCLPSGRGECLAFHRNGKKVDTFLTSTTKNVSFRHALTLWDAISFIFALDWKHSISKDEYETVAQRFSFFFLQKPHLTSWHPGALAVFCRGVQGFYFVVPSILCAGSSNARSMGWKPAKRDLAVTFLHPDWIFSGLWSLP